MSVTTEFIKVRAVKTISAAKSLAATWTWKKKSPADMQADLCAITGNADATPPVVGQEERVSTALRARAAADGLWETQLTELHRRTVQAVGMIKTELADDPALFAVVKNLSASSNSIKETLAEALALESAWTKAAPTWSPTTINTLTAFGTLRKLCNEDLKQAASDAHAACRTEGTKLNAMANALEQSDEAWYADATKVFPPGTPENQMLRGTVPTTYTPKAAKAKPVPAPSTSTGKTP